MEKADLVEDAQARTRGQAVGAQANHDAFLEHGPVGMGRVAEPGMGARAIGDRDAVVVGGRFGAKLPEVGRVEVGAVGNQPVGVA